MCVTRFTLSRRALDNPVTEYYQHAVKIGEELAVDDYDCIISISGDGIVHELYNGMAKHKTPRKAFRIPIAPIPAGSGNGLSLNLLGLKVSLATSLSTVTYTEVPDTRKAPTLSLRRSMPSRADPWLSTSSR